MNDLVRRMIGVLTLTPYAMWQRNHTIQHSTSGNLDRRKTNDIWTLTVSEYDALSGFQHRLVSFREAALVG